jgi:hypothetical protein
MKPEDLDELTRWLITASFRIDITTAYDGFRDVAADYMAIDAQNLKGEVLWYFKRLKPRDLHLLFNAYMTPYNLPVFLKTHSIHPGEVFELRNEAIRYVQSLVK